MSPQWEEEEICWHGKSADVRCFSHAEIFFFSILLLLSFESAKERTGLAFQIKCLFVNMHSLYFSVLIFHGVEQMKE